MRAVRFKRGAERGFAIPLRLEFLLDRSLLESALAWSVKDDAPFADQRDDDPPSALVRLSRAEALRRVTTALRETGSGYTWWSDGLDAHWVDQVQAWAEREVRRCFAPLFLAAGADTAEWATPLLETLAPGQPDG